MTATRDASSHANGFLFADLRDYTRFVERHGDHAAADLLDAYRALVRTEIERSPGAEIRTEGDSFYVVFPSASSAIRTGLAILEAARTANEHDPDRPIQVGIGVHAGETAETAEGLVGSAVNMAARVCSQAKAGELLVTDTVRGLTRTSLPYGFVSVGTRRLKGIEEPVPLFRVTPDRAPADGRGSRSPAGRVARTRRRTGIALVAALLVAGGLASVVGLGALRGVTPSPSPASSAAGRDVSSTEPSLAAATFPSPQERDLLSRVPITVNRGDNCTAASAADATPGAIASIRCDLPIDQDATYAIYERLPGAFELGAAFSGLQSAHSLEQGDCATQPAAWRDWGLEGFYRGTALCFSDAARHAWIVWTYEGSDILARATRDNDDWQRLYAWWKHTSEELRR